VEVDISTGSGGISSEFPVTMQTIRRQELQGTIGDGSGGRIRVSTGSGSVRLVQR
jgi:lia operon protein LiaG